MDSNLCPLAPALALFRISYPRCSINLNPLIDVVTMAMNKNERWEEVYLLPDKHAYALSGVCAHTSCSTNISCLQYTNRPGSTFDGTSASAVSDLL